MPLTDFAVTRRWPPTRPEVLQLYSLPTPNGQKVAVALEEMELPYEAHRVSFSTQDQFTPEFLSVAPNNKIPAILDPNGPGGQPLALFESGAILIYLAEKTGRFLPTGGAARYQVLQWLMWQMGGLGPMFGQVGYFVRYAGSEIADPRPRQRYIDEAKRLLAVLERHLDGREWVAGEFSIADMAIAPWLGSFLTSYEAGPLVDWDSLTQVPGYLQRFRARPSAQKALNIPPES